MLRTTAGRILRRFATPTPQALTFERGLHYGEGFADRPSPFDTSSSGELERFFDAHQTGPGLWKWRHYFYIYERHLGKWVGKPITIVEVGVFSGGSFLMWGHYFGSHARIVGIDIEEVCRAYESERVRIFIGDQADPAFWAGFFEHVPAFDVLIDDGGHEPEQQIVTLEAVLPRLRPGGVYLCEDSEGAGHLFHDYVSGLSRQLHAEAERQPPMIHDALPFQRSIDSIHLYPFVTVIEKRAAPLDRLECQRHGTEWQPFYDEKRADIRSGSTRPGG